MASGQLSSVVHYLRRVAGAPEPAEPTDGQLLERFVQRREEAAFASLMQRHGPMVLDVCRRVLADSHDAEDAFQAAFLVLARKAGTVRKLDSVGSWLYGVAYRLALKARTAAARRRAHERQVHSMSPSDPLAELTWRDLRPVLDAELSRLPEKYRAPVVLCYLEGKTNAEAARQLGWSKGTVSGRLARAREQLRGRLVRRGLALSGAGLALTLSQNAASAAALPAALADSTLKAAVLAAAGKATAAGLISAQAAALAEGVLKTMAMTKLKLTAALVLTVSVLGTGAGVLTYGAGTEPGGDPAAAVPLPVLKADGDKADQSPEKLREENERLRKELAKARAEVKALRERLQATRDEAEAARAVLEKQRQLADEQRRLAEAHQRAADREAARKRLVQADRTKSVNNLKQLALAMHNYLGTNGHFPPPAIYSKDGKPLLSWRVAVLPYIEQDALYKQFHLNEPWDSEHNKKLLAQMPEVFAPPGIKPKDANTTYYQVFTGKGTVFEGPQGVKIADITDGTSNTALIAEAGEAVPWTKPADLPYDASKPLPKLGDLFENGFNVALADGSVHFLPKKFNEKMMRLLITRADGDIVDFDKLRQGP